MSVKIVGNAVRRNVEFLMLQNVGCAFIHRFEAVKTIHSISAVTLHFCSKCIQKAPIKCLLETPDEASTVSKFASAPLTISFELGGWRRWDVLICAIIADGFIPNSYQSCHLHDIHSLRVSWKLVGEGG